MTIPAPYLHSTEAQNGIGIAWVDEPEAPIPALIVSRSSDIARVPYDRGITNYLIREVFRERRQVTGTNEDDCLHDP